jgi:hypothetical protein
VQQQIMNHDLCCCLLLLCSGCCRFITCYVFYVREAFLKPVMIAVLQVLRLWRSPTVLHVPVMVAAPRLPQQQMPSFRDQAQQQHQLSPRPLPLQLAGVSAQRCKQTAEVIARAVCVCGLLLTICMHLYVRDRMRCEPVL